MDDAMLTRMMHISMEFDVKEWAKWAEQNGIDERGINFVLTYPEIVSGERTTPRTLVQFFETITHISDLSTNLGLVKILADSCLDENTVTAFITFINNDLGKLITPEQICNAKNFEREVVAYLKRVAVKDTIRVDILATICTRMVNYLTINQIKPNKAQLDNIKSFVKIDFLPNDIRLTMAQDLVSSKNRFLKSIMADAAIGKMLLGRM